MNIEFINAIKSRCEDCYYFKFYLRNGGTIQIWGDRIHFFNDYFNVYVEGLTAEEMAKTVQFPENIVCEDFPPREFYIPYSELIMFAVAGS